MPGTGQRGAGTGGLGTPIRVEGVFDDPGAIRRLVERNGPYRVDGELPAGPGCERAPGHGGRRRAANLPRDVGGGRCGWCWPSAG
jgi:hypothetical protein